MNRSERITRRLSLPLTFLFVAAAITAIGCNQTVSPLQQTNTGISNGGTNGLFISLNPAGTIFVDVGLSRQVTAILTNDVGNAGVTWTLIGAGTLTNTTTSTVLYTAPSSPSPAATVVATSISDTSQVASATLFITALPTIATTTLPDSTVGAAYNSVINVTAGSAPFNWSLSSGTLPPGLGFSVSSLAGLTMLGSPTVAGHYTFTIQARDVCGAVASQTYTVNIAAAGPSASLTPGTDNASTLAQVAGNGANNSLLNGNYAFGFSGYGAHGLEAAAGSFTADGKGNITGGVQDRNSAAGPQTGMAFTGTYSVGANQLGLMTLNNGDGTTATYAIAVTQEGNARFIEIDDVNGTGTRGSGEMKKRDIAALAATKNSGSYVFELTGVDVRSARLAMIGEFATNDSGALTQGQFDANDAGNMTSLAPISGSYNVSAAGAGSAVLNASGFGSVHLNLYAASPDDAFAVETDARSAGEPLLTGRVLRQSGGPFTTTSLSGSAVLQMMGGANGAPEGIVGVIQFSGTGDARVVAIHANNGFFGNLDEDSFLAPSSEGRAVFGSTGQFITYLASPKQGFVIGTGPGALAGGFEGQDAGPFDAASIAGTFVGATISSSNSAWENAVLLKLDGTAKGAIFTVSFSSSSGPVVDGAPASITYSVADGIVQLNNPGGLSGILFIVSPNKAIYIPMGSMVSDTIMIER